MSSLNTLKVQPLGLLIAPYIKLLFFTYLELTLQVRHRGRRWREEGYEFKASLSCTGSSRPSYWATMRLCLKWDKRGLLRCVNVTTGPPAPSQPSHFTITGGGEGIPRVTWLSRLAESSSSKFSKNLASISDVKTNQGRYS